MLGSPNRAILSKPYLAPGCQLCFQGAKAVIFVTGLCGDKCYYCPVSKDKLYHDVFYVNETKVSTIAEAIQEIQRTGATSASLTGGDPLARLDRTINLITELKRTFGPNFHIHLYTSGRYVTSNVLKKLDDAGLDEIRFHPTVPGLERRIALAKKLTSMTVGAEVPAIPGEEENLLKLALYLEKIRADFMNINELEVSESNYNDLLLRGFKPAPNGVVVKGSKEAAIYVIEEAEKLGLNLPIHFCPATFKDNIQTRNRFRLTIENDIRLYEVDTGKGTIKFGEAVLTIECKGKVIEELEKTGYLFRRNHRFLFHPEDIDILKKELDHCIKEAWIVEAHPTSDRFVLNKTRVI